MSKKANLFIVGAAKCGTTSLHHYLSQHPDIFMSLVKEPHFFSDTESQNQDAYKAPEKGVAYHTKIIRDKSIYERLFEGGQNAKYRGEASPSYLYDVNAANRIYDYNKDAKIIVILRNPIKRAFSHYQMDLTSGLEREKSFYQAILNDEARQQKGWGISRLYVELGFYHTQIKRYYDVFPKNQILLLTQEELKANRNDILKKIFNFLNLPFIEINEENQAAQNTAQKARFSWIPILKRNPIVQSIKKMLGTGLKQQLKGSLYTSGYADTTLDEISFEYLKNKYSKEMDLLSKEYGVHYEV